MRTSVTFTFGLCQFTLWILCCIFSATSSHVASQIPPVTDENGNFISAVVSQNSSSPGPIVDPSTSTDATDSKS